MKRFVFVPIYGYVDNVSTETFEISELPERGFTFENIQVLESLPLGASLYLWDGSCGCTMVRINDGPEPIFEITDNDFGTSARHTLAELLTANSTDEGVCEWLLTAKPGDEAQHVQGKITLSRIRDEADPLSFTEKLACALETAIATEEGNWDGDIEPEWMTHARSLLNEQEIKRIGL